MKPKKIYIGIDPDLRKLTAAIVTDQKKPIAVFLRRNEDKFKDDIAVVNAAVCANKLVQDVIACIVGEYSQFDVGCEIVTIVESQSMMHAKKMHEKGKPVKYEDIRRVGQVAGCLMGCFSKLSNRMYLPQANIWKGNLPKPKAHKRYYYHLGLAECRDKIKSTCYPDAVKYPDLYTWTGDKINPGDFMDINDSLGLALYGVKKGL